MSDGKIVRVCTDYVLRWDRLQEAAARAIAENPANQPPPSAVPGGGVNLPPGFLAAVTGKKWRPGRTLRVRFLDGDPSVQARVEPYAHQWSDYASIRFLFGNDPDAEIRISFSRQGSWSTVGTDALTVPGNEPTMNYGWLRPDTEEDEYSRVVLHEFGHALGCIHEHSSPAADIPWDKQAVYKYYQGPPNYWSKDDVDFNLFERYSQESTQFTEFDKDSIMLYAIPNALTTGDYQVGWNRVLSERDRSFIATLYPKQEVPTGPEPAPVGSAAPPPHFVVFVPGFLGSKLRDRTTGETVWVDFSRVPLNPLQWESWLDHLFQAMRYPNPNLEPAGVVDDVVFAPPWIKQEQYSRLIREMEALGYHADPAQHAEEELNFYTFPYDWRQDNRLSARQLGAAVERWSAMHPGAQVWLMAHSNGGVVCRWYIEKEGGKEHVSRLILVASPWDGSVKAMQMLFNGLDTLFRSRFNLFNIPQRTREVLRTFPAIFQLIPHQAQFLRDSSNQALDPYLGAGWLDDPQTRQVLADAQRFNADLGGDLSVDTLVFFGRKVPTTTSGTVRLSAGQHWDTIDWLQTDAGDGTLTEHAAVFANAHQNIPVLAGHGDIYVNPALYEILRWELVDKYKGAPRAEIRTDRLTVMFLPDCDHYDAGGTINLRATVKRTGDGTPVQDASIRTKLVWRQPLPGSRQTAQPRRLPSVELAAVPGAPGEYAGALKAPAAEGYYRLDATVTVPLEQPLELQELVAIEANPAAAIKQAKSRAGKSKKVAPKSKKVAAKSKARAAKTRKVVTRAKSKTTKAKRPAARQGRTRK